MNRRIISAALAVMLIVAGSVCAFAATGGNVYDSWNTTPAYPTDIVNTKYFTAVKKLMDRKVISGYEDGLFHPEKTITRAEMAKMIIVATNYTSSIPAYESRDTFSDLTGYEWAKGYINTAAGLGFLNGTGNKTFNPGGELTYVEAMAIIVRVTDKVNDSQVPGKWPDNYIEYAVRYNKAGSVEIKDWNAPAPRGDIAIILERNI